MLISFNCPEWIFLDMALIKGGMINVPCYPNMLFEDYEYILNDSNSKMIFVQNQEIYDKVKDIEAVKTGEVAVFSFEKNSSVSYWKELLKRGSENPNPEQVKKNQEATKPEDLLTLVYTSGTTNKPKGVMLSHSNIASQITNLENALNINEETKVISFLPLCHIFERVIMYYYHYKGCKVYFARSLETLIEDVGDCNPNFFPCVPRLLEKIYEKILSKGKELKGIKRSLFFWALNLAKSFEYEKLKNPLYMFQLKIARLLIFSKWKKALGGEVDHIVVGSAATSPMLIRIFTAAGIDIIEGYGLTETSPVVTVNGYNILDRKIGTVGKVIPGVEVKIADDGEILCKGHNIMMGYYNKPKETAEVMIDGWFHTGDIGEMISGGYLKITGRKKEMFKTSGGKYITPQPMENQLKQSPYIEIAMIVGEYQKFPSALICLNLENIQAWTQRKGEKITSMEDAASNSMVEELISQEVEKMNKGHAQYEKVKKFRIIPDVWSIETKELTPTLKLKRRVVKEKYAPLIQSIYE